MTRSTNMQVHSEEGVTWITIAGIVALLTVFLCVFHLGTALGNPPSRAYKPAPASIVAAARQKAMPPRHTLRKVAWVICHVVGRRQCVAFLNVAWCESTLNMGASDYASGTHKGLFQLGPAERREYGYGHDAWSQTRGAKRLHARRGWQPWVCKPTAK